jgi:hypothetical protein
MQLLNCRGRSAGAGALQQTAYRAAQEISYATAIDRWRTQYTSRCPASRRRGRQRIQRPGSTLFGLLVRHQRLHHVLIECLAFFRAKVGVGLFFESGW